MTSFSESINLKNINVIDSDSSIENSLTADLHQNLKNVMANGALFTEDQAGGAKKKKTVSKKSKRAGSKRGSKKAGSKKGSKKAGSKKGSKKAGSKRPGSKKGSKKAGSKKGSKRAGSKSKRAGSKSKRAQPSVVDVEQAGAGRKKKGGKNSSRSRSPSLSTAQVHVATNLSDSIDNNSSELQQGGKKTKKASSSKSPKRLSKGSKAKRELPEKLKEFQRLVKHMASGLGHSPTLFSLAKVVRTEAMKSNPNATPKQLTDASIKLFEDKKAKYTKELEALKAAKVKAKAAKN